MTISNFLDQHFLHFNAASLVDAAKGYKQHLNEGGKMMVTLAGAMSTAELGKSLAEMIRQDKVHIICCTGANLEEDLFNLIAHDFYLRIPNYRDLSPQEEEDLLKQHFNRVTDTCIPEQEAMRRVEKQILKIWKKAHDEGERYFPHEFFYELIRSKVLVGAYQINPENSWLVAACQKNIPIIVPGWEDSTIGNMFAGHCITNEIEPTILKTGVEYMMFLAKWYQKNSAEKAWAFFK